MAGSLVNESLTNLVNTLCPSDKEINEGKKRFDQIQRILHQSRVRNGPCGEIQTHDHALRWHLTKLTKLF